VIALLRANRVLRAATLVLVALGVAVHLWVATRAGLVLIAIGVGAHLAAALLGRHWWARRQREQSMDGSAVRLGGGEDRSTGAS
jgi:hypothetical protein